MTNGIIATTLLTLSMVFISCTHDAKRPIIGLWKLVDMQEQDSKTDKWQPYKKEMQGYLLYDADSHMSLHMTVAGYEKTDLHFHDLADSVSVDELKHRSMSYNYMANYEFDPVSNIVTHHRISHSNPLEWNTSVKRSVAFNSDTLILTTLDRTNGAIKVKWLKIK